MNYHETLERLFQQSEGFNQRYQRLVELGPEAVEHQQILSHLSHQNLMIDTIVQTLRELIVEVESLKASR